MDDAFFRAKRYFLGANRVRRARVFGVGMGKTGTHSLAAMFSPNVRAAHEAEATQIIGKALDCHSGKIGEAELTQWILERDRRLALEMDSSGANFHVMDILLREFPNAKFILTVRDCYSWVTSSLNQQLRSPKVEPERHAMRDLRFGKGRFTHAPEEKILQEKGLYPLEGYLSLWTWHNREVLEKIPAQKLLIVRTNEISKRAYEIADFSGLPRYSVCLEKTHEFRNPQKQLTLRDIDRDYLERTVEKHCRPLMAKFFSEIKSLDDVKL